MGLFEQSDCRQRGEDEVTQIAVVNVERIMNAALVAKTF
jgi:hypothetical protein